MISTRHLPVLAVLLAAAMVPTVRHSYVQAAVLDGRETRALPLRLGKFEGHPTERSLDWVRETLQSDDFIERRYRRDLTLFVARSFDAKRLYHHPELAIAHGDTYEHSDLLRSPGNAVPVRVLLGPAETSVYVLQHGDVYIDDPIRFQLRNTLSLLIRPRELTTLFFVRSATAIPRDRIEGSAAIDLLFAAVDAFAAQPKLDGP